MDGTFHATSAAACDGEALFLCDDIERKVALPSRLRTAHPIVLHHPPGCALPFQLAWVHG